MDDFSRTALGSGGGGGGGGGGNGSNDGGTSGAIGGLLTGGNNGGIGSGNDSATGTGTTAAATTTALTAPPSTSSSNFTRIRSTTRSTMAKATAVRVSTGKKFSQLLIITPAVAIDSNEHDDYRGPFNSSSLDSGCGGSSEGSLSDDTPDPLIGSDSDRRRRLRHSGDRQRQQQGDAPSGMQTRSSGSGTAAAGWRWCGLICSAVKCFRAAATATGTTTATSGAKQRGGPFGAGSTIRYTSAGDGTDQQHHQSQQPQQYQYDAR
ncbi:glycine, alanine and asparagine-rich protein-like [Anopheles aquasalis]|uniref:glycine, alanine and asparagine-rich protein-like n=1 Tax=Anopheles aquasalis TaxID=42839 RepID=UPI00215A1129|nr:glycine, alanine and asparagine-rich protein-like [Anopheles aquasalis]